MSTMFLVMSLLLPRCTLAYCYLAGCMPENHTPFAADAVAFFLAPRLLVADWTYEAGLSPIWTALFIGVWFSSMLGSRSALNKTHKGEA